MIGRPGSTLWLLGHEIRLSWRTLIGGRRGRARMVGLGIIGVLILLGGTPLAFAMRGVDLPVNNLSILAGDMVAAVLFTLMLSQTLAGAAEALYARGDLDLIFSSPLDPRRALTVRFGAMAATAFAPYGLLILPVLIPMAALGHWPWLALLPALAALALAASGAGLALAVGLFALIGPRRTRTVAQLLAAVIGAAFFLTSQTRYLLGGARSTSFWTQVIAAGQDPHLQVPAIAGWPLRAAMGEPLPLAGLLVVAAALFLGVSAWLSRRFAADAAAAQGADVAVAKTSAGAGAAFVGGVFATTLRKELRLLWRDIALLAQVLLRVLYLLPAGFVLMRSAAAHQDLAVAGGAAAIVFLAGQVASSLTWITISAEDAPELIAASPAALAVVMRAKLTAGLAPLAVMLIIPLGFVTVVSPLAGVAAIVGSAANALAAGLINAWRPAPGKRSEFRRRRGGSVLLAFALLGVSACMGGATALAAMGWVWALIPAALGALLLLALRQSPAKVAEALVAQG